MNLLAKTLLGELDEMHKENVKIKFLGDLTKLNTKLVEIIENAAEYAYNQGWDSLEKGLIGGIEFMKRGYMDKGQNTLYLQKFDIVNQDGSLYTNQYMQNLLAPMSEASNMLEIYEASDTMDSNLKFIIPLYENMPEEISER